ncbi:MAG: hypothetical protein M0T74_12450, partial [Desulfitobacterium hafniense]|nr:hypothetical protein [Desulfitobacterium hafniense]
DYPWWNTLYIQLENLKHRLTVLWTTVQHLIDMFNTEEDMEIDSFLSELLSFDRELSSMLEGVTLVMDIKNNNRVTWLERSGTISVKTSPVDVKEVLQEKIFSRLDSTILTSATMTVASSFNHFLQQVGLPATTRSIQVESPFDYDNQMQFFVVKDLPIQAEESCVQQIAEFIAEVTTIMGGRTLVLFTSNKLLNEIYQELNSKINDFQVLGQGIDGNRSVVLEQFLRNSNSVLLGANSFWEGIDIQGQALSCVILVKLPFWPPSMPLIEARSELLELQGINSFREFLLPEAVIRFKQGFGRLIRSRVDKGVVILLDSRVIIKSYGKVFLSSVPVRTHIRGDRSQVLRNLNSWIENEYKQKELS